MLTQDSRQLIKYLFDGRINRDSLEDFLHFIQSLFEYRQNPAAACGGETN